MKPEGTGFMRMRPLLLALALLALFPVTLAGAGAQAARLVRPKLKFTESFGDVRARNNVTQEGVLQAEGVLLLAGLPLKSFNEKTDFFVGIGSLTWAGTLADDPKYRPGKKSAHFRDGGRDLRFDWNRRRLLLTLTVHTKRGEPGAFAETFMPLPDGPVQGIAISFISFGDRASHLDISYQGTKTTRDGLRKVCLSGSGDTECGCF